MGSGMTKKIFLSVLCSIAFLGMLLPQKIFAGAILQISTEPGVSVWLNKDFMGKTDAEQNGMVIKDLAPGEYVLKAFMPGYDPVETLVSAENGKTVEWRIQLVKPAVKVEDEVKRIESKMVRSEPMGTIFLKSIPLNAEIFLDGKSIGPADKKLTYVPAGEHAARFVLQKHELVKKFSLEPDEEIFLQADFMQGTIAVESIPLVGNLGPAVIKMETSRSRKPALFPHRRHQEKYDCADCHHGMDSAGNQIPYSEGMEIKHCVTCHNAKMKNKRLNGLMLAAHTRCKGCHKKVVEESGKAGPIARCSGCHEVANNE